MLLLCAHVGIADQQLNASRHKDIIAYSLTFQT